MQKEIHPEYFQQAKVTCSCGNEFVVGATVPEFRVDICSNCHPLYTGKKKLVDTAGRVDRFQARLQKTAAKKEGAKK
ncbi:MAG: 50S ribosomal protein L31 [Candidatus Berkelbacteria bacterium]|nr:MAG: 50S ribosomal protein L31 [Candidatus Berkelbacteria bacterium]QQG51548.1 MAG: 50S ribosomal protein L31 [Candidatus Berkelbacteria bacterium]